LTKASKLASRDLIEELTAERIIANIVSE
jgi:hypothetical protein